MGQENRNRHCPGEDALASTLDACVTRRNSTLIALSPPWRDYAKIFRLLARQAGVARDANSAVVRIAARNVRSNRGMLDHGATVPG